MEFIQSKILFSQEADLLAEMTTLDDIEAKIKLARYVVPTMP